MQEKELIEPAKKLDPAVVNDVSSLIKRKLDIPSQEPEVKKPKVEESVEVAKDIAVEPVVDAVVESKAE